jgi:hypothetical protein
MTGKRILLKLTHVPTEWKQKAKKRKKLKIIWIPRGLMKEKNSSDF